GFGPRVFHPIDRGLRVDAVFVRGRVQVVLDVVQGTLHFVVSGTGDRVVKAGLGPHPRGDLGWAEPVNSSRAIEGRSEGPKRPRYQRGKLAGENPVFVLDPAVAEGVAQRHDALVESV